MDWAHMSMLLLSHTRDDISTDTPCNLKDVFRGCLHGRRRLLLLQTTGSAESYSGLGFMACSGLASAAAPQVRLSLHHMNVAFE